ncbi:hypothetical protein GCM10023093_28530 [Nemorincola caseinilytica]|uniref:DUF2306 domain-containing protein n=1 Tax=Nemorincola caseinilytica TaxID=2054315 RepID=A0ABP8NPK3_9BACT
MHKILLVIHVIAATVALVSGMFAILARKGRGVHTGAGLTYYASMYGTALSAVIMSVMKWNPFLLSIGIFALYLVYSGRKAIWYKRLKAPYTPALKDKLAAYIGLATGTVMLGYPLYQYSTHSGPAFSVLQVFGFILLLYCLRDLQLLADPRNFTPHNNKVWLPRHIGAMGGAYISTVTALLVVNVHFSPGWVVWLAPTAVGSVLISRSIARIRPRRAHTPATTE